MRGGNLSFPTWKDFPFSCTCASWVTRTCFVLLLCCLGIISKCTDICPQAGGMAVTMSYSHRVWNDFSLPGWERVVFAFSSGWSCSCLQVKQGARCRVVEPLTQAWGGFDTVCVAKTSGPLVFTVGHYSKLRNLCECVFKDWLDISCADRVNTLYTHTWKNSNINTHIYFLFLLGGAGGI